MRFMILFVAVFALRISSAQSLSPQLIGSAGQSAAAGSNDVEWSVGEPVIGPFADSSNTTHGFQELEDNIGSPIVPAFAGLSRMRLQRSLGSVKILFDKAQAGYEVRLYNGQGRGIRNFSVAKGQKELSIPTRDLASGAVLMSVYTRDMQQVQNFKFIGGEGQ